MSQTLCSLCFAEAFASAHAAGKGAAISQALAQAGAVNAQQVSSWWPGTTEIISVCS